MAGSEPTYVGVVKSFNPAKGWGFVECAETMQVYGSDVFLLRTELQGFCVAKGDRISFAALQSQKGVQATNITVLSTGPDGSRHFFGEVKSYNALKGFGFISGPAVEKVFGKDVFVMRSELPSGAVPIGAQVHFKARAGDRGPVASEVQVLGGAGADLGGMMQQWAAWQPQLAWPAAPPHGWGGSPQPPWGFPAPAARPPSGHEVFFGELKQVNEEKGWGHVACGATQKIYGRDMFVMRSDLEGLPLQVGAAVSFAVAQGPRGPHATGLRAVDAAALERTFAGKVKSYNDSKGWGFIESPEAREALHTDVFLHRRDLQGAPCSAGVGLRFRVNIDSGRASAKDVAVDAPLGTDTDPGVAPEAAR